MISSALPAMGVAVSQPIRLALPLALFGVGGLLWPTTSPQMARLGELATSGRLLAPRSGEAYRIRLAGALRRVIAASSSRWLIPLGAGALAWALRMHLLSLAVASVSLVAHRGLLRRWDERRRRREAVAAAAAVSILCAELAAGSRPELGLAAAAGAAEAAPGLAEALSAAADAVRVGDDPATVLISSSDPPHATLLSVATAWRLSARTGTALVSVLERLGEDLRARQASEEAVAAAVAGARSSAMLLALLPAVGCGLGAAMGAKPWTTLTQTTAGQVLGLIGALLDVGGLLWTAQLVRRAGRG